jgi:hypothetical protein
MATRYRIYAYSPTHNQKQQQHDLLNDTQLADINYAQLRAKTFAETLNKNFFLYSCDWQPSIEAYEHVEDMGSVDLSQLNG